jgi:hypothetical protein
VKRVKRQKRGDFRAVIFIAILVHRTSFAREIRNRVKYQPVAPVAAEFISNLSISICIAAGEK